MLQLCYHYYMLYMLYKSNISHYIIHKQNPHIHTKNVFGIHSTTATMELHHHQYRSHYHHPILLFYQYEMQYIQLLQHEMMVLEEEDYHQIWFRILFKIWCRIWFKIWFIIWCGMLFIIWFIIW